MKKGIAGSVESNDCLITVYEHDSLKININSIVYDFFKDNIENTIRKTLEELNIDKIKVVVEDKGALDYTIRARLITAIKRMGNNDA
ncbi:MAG TPA: citrate lyase acyl carrier protein [Acholeplasmataceae bacterium]|jgi:citrate lyase subunit gamma (acyl carrier protein)|nr:citrate lyase acyl carrier protein [Acholeplasmataceae bacterium]